MLLLLEIYYCVKAFKKGWRFRAPGLLALMFVGGFFIGLMGGEHPENMLPVAIVLDVCMLFVLRYMSKHAPADAIVPAPPQTTDKPVTAVIAG